MEVHIWYKRFIHVWFLTRLKEELCWTLSKALDESGITLDRSQFKIFFHQHDNDLDVFNYDIGLYLDINDYPMDDPDKFGVSIEKVIKELIQPVAEANHKVLDVYVRISWRPSTATLFRI